MLSSISDSPSGPLPKGSGAGLNRVLIAVFIFAQPAAVTISYRVAAVENR
jgi:hypothetical protein